MFEQDECRDFRDLRENFTQEARSIRVCPNVSKTHKKRDTKYLGNPLILLEPMSRIELLTC